MDGRQEICNKLESLMGDGFTLKSKYDFDVVDEIFKGKMTIYEGYDALQIAHAKFTFFAASAETFAKYLKDNEKELYSFEVV